MNDRIKELLLEAEKSVQFLSNSADSKKQIIMDKFAELIVQECAKIAKGNAWSPMSLRCKIESEMKSHFGV